MRWGDVGKRAPTLMETLSMLPPNPDLFLEAQSWGGVGK